MGEDSREGKHAGEVMSGTNGTSIVEMLRVLAEACEVIQGKNECSGCPMKADCFCEQGVTFWDVCNDTTIYNFDSFLKYADEVEYRVSEEDSKALHADDLRKAELEERMIDEECP